MSHGKTIVVIDAISRYSQQLCKEQALPGAELLFYTDEAQLEANLPKADVIITSTRGVTPDFLARAEKCRFIIKLGTGVNNICTAEASRKGVWVGNVAGQNALSVAEYAVSLILASCRHINIVHDRLIQKNEWMKSTIRDFCCELSEKTVGIVGFGNIGRHAASLLKGFACDILYYDVAAADRDTEEALNARYCPLDELFAASDVVSLHLPLNEQTHYIVNARTIGLMKEDAVLVNTGRGGLIDEAALLKALQAGKFLGVALDTHENEPVLADDPLKEIERVIFSPHTGAGTKESMNRVIRSAFININAVLQEGEPKEWKNIVNATIQSRCKE